MKSVCAPLFYIRHKKVGGSEYASYGLLRGLAQLDTKVAVVTDDKRNLAPEFLSLCRAPNSLNLITWGEKFHLLEPASPARAKRFLHEYMFSVANREQFDATIYPNYFVPPTRNSKLGARIGIIHDLQHRHMPQYFPLAKRVWLERALSLTFRYADQIVFLTNTALEDAKRLYPRNVDSRWLAIPNAVSWDDFGIRKDTPARKVYILSVANHFPHKNVETLIRSFVAVAKYRPDVQLVLAGQRQSAFKRSSKGFGVNLERLVAELGLRHRVEFTGFVTRSELGQLYANASCFAFPSTFEGFGLPPIEALGYGVPCIVSDIPVLREVTLGLAKTVSNYRSPAAWTEAIIEALEGRGASKTAAEKVRSEYSATTVARRYLALA